MFIYLCYHTSCTPRDHARSLLLNACFSSRKSLPCLVLSDNGSTFLSAADELKALFTHRHLSKSGTMVIYPQMCSQVWGVLGEAHWVDQAGFEEGPGKGIYNLNSLQTLIVEIEAILNDWPLTYVPTDISDPHP